MLVYLRFVRWMECVQVVECCGFVLTSEMLVNVAFGCLRFARWMECVRVVECCVVVLKSEV